jgi:hypothetical protein
MTADQAQAAPGAGDPATVSLPLSATEQTRHRRLPHLGRAGRQPLYAVLRAGLVAHLGVIIDGWPMVVPHRAWVRRRHPAPARLGRPVMGASAVVPPDVRPA